MNKQAYLENVYNSAFNDELEKIAKKDSKKSITSELRSELIDPRLYSNLRGMISLESRKKRIAAHKNLGKGGTISSAINQGFFRNKD